MQIPDAFYEIVHAADRAAARYALGYCGNDSRLKELIVYFDLISVLLDALGCRRSNRHESLLFTRIRIEILQLCHHGSPHLAW